MESAERPLLEYLAQRSLTFPGASLFRAQCFTFVVVHQRSWGDSKNPRLHPGPIKFFSDQDSTSILYSAGSRHDRVKTVQWLELHCRGRGSIPERGTKVSQNPIAWPNNNDNKIYRIFGFQVEYGRLNISIYLYSVHKTPLNDSKGIKRKGMFLLTKWESR